MTRLNLPSKVTRGVLMGKEIQEVREGNGDHIVPRWNVLSGVG